MPKRYTLKDMSDYFGHLAEAPDAKQITELELALAASFRLSVSVMHDQTGAGEASGRIYSEMIGDRWEGTIAYGGPGVEGPYWEWYRDDRANEGKIPSPHGAFFYILDTTDDMWANVLRSGLD